MARWQLTIKQPNSATPAIPNLVLEAFGQSGYQPGLLQRATLTDLTIGGNAILTGTPYSYRRTWAIAAEEPESKALILEALVHWQDTTLAANGDGLLELIDELEYLPPEPSPHSKVLLSGSSFTPFTGHITGFGVHKVKLQLSEQHKTHLAVSGDNTLIKLLAFSAVEVISAP
jgi:hypothetical protein